LSSELFFQFLIFKVVHSFKLVIIDGFFLSWHLTIHLRNLLAHVHNILRFVLQNLICFLGSNFVLFLNEVTWILSWRKKLLPMKILTRLHDLAQGLSHLVSKFIWSNDRLVLWILHVGAGQLIEFLKFKLILISINLIFMNWSTNLGSLFSQGSGISFRALLGRNFWDFGFYVLNCLFWQLLFRLAVFQTVFSFYLLRLKSLFEIHVSFNFWDLVNHKRIFKVRKLFLLGPDRFDFIEIVTWIFNVKMIVLLWIFLFLQIRCPINILILLFRSSFHDVYKAVAIIHRVDSILNLNLINNLLEK